MGGCLGKKDGPGPSWQRGLLGVRLLVGTWGLVGLTAWKGQISSFTPWLISDLSGVSHLYGLLPLRSPVTLSTKLQGYLGAQGSCSAEPMHWVFHWR